MPRFVIQEHTQDDGIHYDLMLEYGEALKTWRIPLSPTVTPQTIEQIQDHRKLYLDFEGEISGNRGTVRIWDQGDYQLLQWGMDHMTINFEGKLLSGHFLLQLTSQGTWQFKPTNPEK
jgi:hypothetical protein